VPVGSAALLYFSTFPPSDVWFILLGKSFRREQNRSENKRIRSMYRDKNNVNPREE
jgi:hypothetical protein